jgi:hypothetical protein
LSFCSPWFFPTSLFLSIVIFARLLDPTHAEAAPTTRNEIQKRTEKGALKYFEEQTHSVTGLALDRAENFKGHDRTKTGLASLAATGFAIAVQANAADRGLANRAEVYDKTLRTLRFCRDHVSRWRGWFSHFVNWETGERMWNSEYSSIDTALLLAGALYAAEIFPQTELAKIANELYETTDFEVLRTNEGRLPKKLTLSMGYYPESGFIPTQWDMYAEQAILLILGLGHPTHPLPASSWLVFSRELRNGVMGYDQALFVHQYSQLFLDFKNHRDAFSSYFENSAKITQAQRAIAANKTSVATFREGFWGFSAGLAPNENYEVTSAAHHGTTACIGCAQASVQFLPDEVTEDLIRWTDGPLGLQLWGRYGLTDSVDLDRNFISPSVFAITLAPAYLSFANLDAQTSVWRRFMKIPGVIRGFERAGFAPAQAL